MIFFSLKKFKSASVIERKQFSSPNSSGSGDNKIYSLELFFFSCKDAFYIAFAVYDNSPRQLENISSFSDNKLKCFAESD